MVEVLYFDNHLVIVNKPAGVLSQGEGSIEEEVKAWLKKELKKTGEVFLHAAHRLDRVTSGVLVFAKTSKALTRLNASIRKGSWKKIYWALIEGTWKGKQGALVHHLRHGSFRSEEDEDGKRAELLYRKIGDGLLEITLKTGRYHQIRNQLSLCGHPILGDKKYGSSKSYPGSGIALHHRQLTLPHPVTKELLTVTAPCPFLPDQK